ncbi:phosphotransferase [Paenibacillus albus]|uniref:phosphotransferase n=1 Tax=Paenibacillus albus TaxID=2495582 RepID=UPI001D1309BB|nr:phosphotransferase [Paenibacillus albus]
MVSGNSQPWSVVLKIVIKDPKRDNPTHYNYWKREVLAYESGYLNHLPAGITVPRCLAIDYKQDDSVWLWLEDIQHDGQQWERNDYAFAAEALGQFHAAYLLGEPLPEFQWINQNWMQSWVNECYQYGDVPGTMTSRDEAWLTALHSLPRTLSHQDFYEQNILFQSDNQSNRRLTLIDWQFISVSGIGEDLGRFFGLSLSRGNVPLEYFQEYQNLFISSYIKGLRRSGWVGDERLPRFGFLAAFALRADWEIPKLHRKLEQDRNSPTAIRLMSITELQMESALEAERLRRELGNQLGTGEIR